MSDIQIIGLVLVSVCIICLTIMAREWLLIKAAEKRRAERERRQREQTRDDRFHDAHEAMWAEERTKRIAAEQEVIALKKEIERMEHTMGAIKIAKMKEYR